METRKDNMLESLDEMKRSWVLELATHAKLVDIVMALKEQGIETSAATLSRFIRRDREKRLLEEGQEMQPAVQELAERGKEGRFREGTTEALRQRLYERALCSQNPEEAQKMYAALVREEARLRELDLEARKVAIAEEGLKLQRLRFEMEAAATTGQKRGRVKATVESSETVVEVNAGSAPKQLEAGEGKRAMELLGKVEEILNRGGDMAHRIIEARGVLAEGVKELGG